MNANTQDHLNHYQLWLRKESPLLSSSCRESILIVTENFFVHTRKYMHQDPLGICTPHQMYEFEQFLYGYTHVLPDEMIPLLFEPIRLYQKYLQTTF